MSESKYRINYIDEMVTGNSFVGVGVLTSIDPPNYDKGVF